MRNKRIDSLLKRPPAVRAFRKLLAVLCLLLAHLSILHAQAYEVLEIDAVPIDSGSLQGEIRAVLLDSRGLLWIGSGNGLARYDGYRVIPCPLKGMKAGADAARSVRGLHEDARGRLWLATAQGLACYEPETGRTAWFRHDPQRPNTLGHNDITCLQVLPAAPDRLWVASSGGTLDEVDLESSDVFRRLPGSSFSAPDGLGRVQALLGDASGVLWIGTESGLHRYLPLDGQIRRCPIPAAALGGRTLRGVKAIFSDPRHPDGLWIGSDGPGLFRYFPAGDSWQAFPFGSTFKDFPAEIVIHVIATYPGDRQYLIVGTHEGLYRFDPASGNFRTVVFKQPPAEENMWISRCTRILSYDRLGNFWIGSCRDGLYKWSPWKKTFSSIRPYPNALPNPLANWVTSIMELDRRGILLTTYGGGAFLFDRDSGNLRNLLLDPSAPDRVLNLFINECRVGKDGTLWFVTDEGLARCSSTGRLQRLLPYGHDRAATENLRVWGFVEDGAADFWLATSRGLMGFDPATGVWHVDHHDPHDPRSLSNDRVYFLLEEPGAGLWIGTDDGLNLRAPHSDGFTVFRNDPADPASLSDNFIYFLLRDSQGRIWITTGNGLNLVRRRQGKIYFQRFQVPGGGRDRNFFTAMVQESDRYFWVGTRAGLARFDSREGTFTFYDRRDGLRAEGRDEGYIGCRSRDGEFFFGGRSGFVRFRHEPASLNPHPPPVLLTGFQADSGGGSAATKNPISPLMPGRTLRAVTTGGRASLNLEFAALDFVRPDKNQYAFRLEGRDKDWIYQGTGRVVRLAGLRPGRHTLRVKAANNDGVWNENGVALEIEVRLPFWRPWRIALLAGLLLAGAGFYLVWIRRQRRRWMAHAVIPENLDAILDRFALSKREGEILRLLLAGKSNKEIENELFIAMATVKIHVHNIFRKMKVNSRMQLILLVQQEAKKSP